MSKVANALRKRSYIKRLYKIEGRWTCILNDSLRFIDTQRHTHEDPSIAIVAEHVVKKNVERCTCANCPSLKLSGDRVRIYEDPMTLEKFEGIAILLKFISERFDGFQRWTVSFDNEEEIVERLIHTDWPLV